MSRYSHLGLEQFWHVSAFFKYSFFLSSFGYAIFGSKPISFETVNPILVPLLEENCDYLDIFHIFDKLRLKKCCETWSKYSHLFPLKNFSLISYPFLNNPELIEISIINHNNFIKIVTAHLKDFQLVLGKNMTPEQILKEYIKGKGEIFLTIRNHDGLFGTLLGFGRNNAWKYMEQKGGYSIKESFTYSYFEPKDNRRVLKPAFKVIPDTPETTNLRNNYEKQEWEISQIYQQKNFLDVVLNKLTGNSN